MVISWLRAFALTQLIEAPVYAAALHGAGRGESASPKNRSARLLALGLVPSALTHPVVWFVFPTLTQGPLEVSYLAMVACAELFAHREA